VQVVLIVVNSQKYNSNNTLDDKIGIQIWTGNWHWINNATNSDDLELIEQIEFRKLSESLKRWRFSTENLKKFSAQIRGVHTIVWPTSYLPLWEIWQRKLRLSLAICNSIYNQVYVLNVKLCKILFSYGLNCRWVGLKLPQKAWWAYAKISNS